MFIIIIIIIIVLLLLLLSLLSLLSLLLLLLLLSLSLSFLLLFKVIQCFPMVFVRFEQGLNVSRVFRHVFVGRFLFELGFF